jgi:hypothetical protein
LTASVTPEKTGYKLGLAPGPGGVTGITDCNGTPTAADYYITAEPLAFGTTGHRGFASDEVHVIWQDQRAFRQSSRSRWAGR